MALTNGGSLAPGPAWRPCETGTDRSARREALQAAGLDSVLDDLRAGPPPSSGEWLARLVRRIRPSRRAFGKLLPPAIDSEYLRDLVDEVFRRAWA